MCIILLQLEHQPSFESECATLIDKLKLKSGDWRIVTTAKEAMEIFKLYTHPVVLATDHGLALPKHRKLRDQACLYTSMGGELFFAGQFASLATPEQITTLFSAFGMPWEAGDVIEGEFDVNEDMERIKWDDISYRYSQKALCLKNVRDDEVLYRPCPWVEGVDLKQASVASSSDWDGWIGYVGDLGDTVESANALRTIMFRRGVWSS